MSQKCCHIPPLPPKFNVDVRKSFGGGAFHRNQFRKSAEPRQHNIEFGGKGGCSTNSVLLGINMYSIDRSIALTFAKLIPATVVR